jgi:hypothetical protein
MSKLIVVIGWFVFFSLSRSKNYIIGSYHALNCFTFYIKILVQYFPFFIKSDFKVNYFISSIVKREELIGKQHILLGFSLFRIFDHCIFLLFEWHFIHKSSLKMILQLMKSKALPIYKGSFHIFFQC